MTAFAEPPVRRTRPVQRYPDPIPLPPADGEAIDYWEEVALARLRLARLALILVLLGTAVIAPIMG